MARVQVQKRPRPGPRRPMRPVEGSGVVARRVLKHVERFVDRHGKTRIYYRPEKGKRVRLPANVTPEEFLAAYEAARAAYVMTVSVPPSPEIDSHVE